MIVGDIEIERRGSRSAERDTLLDDRVNMRAGLDLAPEGARSPRLRH